MQLVCPRCNNRVNELMECEDCKAIGCVRCMRRRYGRWVCFRCETPKEDYTEREESERVSNAFSAMFG